PQEVQSNLVSGLIDKVFKGSTSALVQTLVKGENISEKELKELKDMIDDMED
ncbi:MAG: BlaI/MecI/CopY family transcriptional regulator, partial [Gracilimonas sp.]|nr:BlaI/MecI/CopY family transcriptional regulator [Gracilimonas sp.]